MLMLFAKLQTISLRKVELEKCLMALLGTTPVSNYPNGRTMEAASQGRSYEHRSRDSPPDASTVPEPRVPRSDVEPSSDASPLWRRPSAGADGEQFST